MRDMCAVPVENINVAIPCKHVKGKQDEHSGVEQSCTSINIEVSSALLTSFALPPSLVVYVCVCVCELRLLGRKIKKTLGTCKRTLHNQMYGMAIGASFVLHHEVIGSRVMLVGVVNVQRGQVAIFACILQHVIGTEAI